MKTKKNTIISVLNTAKNYIAANGWMQDDLFREKKNGEGYSIKGPVCMLGALAKATEQYGTKVNYNYGEIDKHSKVFRDAENILIKAINKLLVKNHKNVVQGWLGDEGIGDEDIKATQQDWQSAVASARDDFKSGLIDKKNYSKALSDIKIRMAKDVGDLQKEQRKILQNPDFLDDIPIFNDEYAKNKKEVLEVFDIAINMLKDMK